MSKSTPLFAGIDLGTSGVRGVLVDQQLQTRAAAFENFHPVDDNRRDPQLWRTAVQEVISQLLAQVAAQQIVSIAIDGTSGTMLAVDKQGIPQGPALLYNDPCTNQQTLDAIATHAPESSAVHGATSGLARAITLAQQYPSSSILHEADWIAFGLSDCLGISDENNALKTGYDPRERQWPEWIEHTGISRHSLPHIVAAGDVIGPVSAAASNRTGLDTNTLVVAGTTDGCASFLATGAALPGDGVTVLGSTMTIKLLSDKPVYAPHFGIYSHRIGDRWLAGGASNTGGQVLAKYFTIEQIEKLSLSIDPSVPTGLDYYPLVSRGERFPFNDSQLAPRLQPRPENDSQFLHGMLEGIANIEALAYHRLQELGAPRVRSMRSIGGGTRNTAWSAIRQTMLNVPLLESISDQAAVGVASLARDGFNSRNT